MPINLGKVLCAKRNDMKKLILTSAIALGLVSGTAQAVNLNPDGLGQVLFYPYYTVNGGNVTLVSLVNTTDDAKAVKVRFMESKNSREVLDFNLYLSAKDVWVAAIVDDNGVPTLVVNDTSCTTPYLYPDKFQPFLPYAMDNPDITRAREGHIEVIEMGTVVGESAEAATHVTQKVIDDITVEFDPPVPADCQMLNDAWTTYTNAEDGYWIDDPHTDMEAPSGGLFGGASVINVETGTMYGFEAKAINGFATKVGELHQVPGTVLPSLNSGDVKTATVFLGDGTTFISPEFERGVDAISYVFMHDNLMNEYTIEDVVDAATDWIITFPTKSFYVDSTVAEMPFDIIDEEKVYFSLPPFSSVWDGKEACEVVLVDSIYDREETGVSPIPGPPVVSPAPPQAPRTGLELCFETNILEFGNRGVFNSPNAVQASPEVLGFEHGWANIDMTNAIDEDGRLTSRSPLGNLKGLPVVGFAAYEFVNSFVGEDGVLANYSGISPHRATRDTVDIVIEE